MGAIRSQQQILESWKNESCFGINKLAYMSVRGSKTRESPVAVQGGEKKGSADQWMRVLPAPDAELTAIAAALVSKANTDTTLSPPGPVADT